MIELDASARRSALIALGRYRRELAGNGVTVPPGFDELVAWLEEDVMLYKRDAEARRKRLNREAAKRYRDREREARAGGA